jgi:hypothetical protein
VFISLLCSAKHFVSQRVVSPGRTVLCALLLFGVSGIAPAENLLPVTTLTSLPPPGLNAFSTTFRYDSQGILFAWDGYHVWKQNGVNLDAFTQIGTVIAADDGGPHNYADAGPVNFSADEQRILLGNGNGGWGAETSAAGLVWSMPISGGTVSLPAGTQPVGNIPYHNDFLSLPATSTIAGKDTKYFVNQGIDYSGSGSIISIFDETTHANVSVVTNGPGATTALAFDSKNNRLYAGVGFDPGRGNIYSFSLDQLDQAFETNTPLDFVNDGVLFNTTISDNQSGAGMFFDANGYLFSGGTEGITCFKPDGSVSNVLDMGAYTSLVYNAFNDEVLAIPYFPGTTGWVFSAHDFESVPEPGTLCLMAIGLGCGAFGWRWRRKA